jgi:hypothetical protein
MVRGMKHPSDDLAELAGGPCTYTFAAHLPFPLGIPDHLGHTILLNDRYADPSDVSLYGDQLQVRIRVFTLELRGLPLWPPGTHDALKRFYNYDLEADRNARFGEETLEAHEQWVSLETPSAPGPEELKREDPAFAFHRCLVAFNVFLRGVQAATRDVRIRPVTSHDLRPVVIVGALVPDQPWRILTEVLMHPEARPDPLPPPGGPITERQLQSGIDAVITNRPYVTTILWRSRAQRALRQRGDPADAIISFQIAAESLLFDTYRMLLVDEGCTSSEIQAELEGDIPFKSLLVKIMPSKLGGRWDVGRPETAVGKYWETLYLVRGSVIHAGHDPHGGEAYRAQDGYWSLRDHVEERLLANRARYPRTVLARFGQDGLQARGCLTNRMRGFLKQVESEPGPWYWPYDVAGRDSSV